MHVICPMTSWNTIIHFLDNDVLVEYSTEYRMPENAIIRPGRIIIIGAPLPIRSCKCILAHYFSRERHQ